MKTVLRDKLELSPLQHQMHVVIVIMYKHYTIHPILENPFLPWLGQEKQTLPGVSREKGPQFMLGCI